RERAKLAQRQEMLAAALALFSEKGYRNASMQEIAEKADFAIGTIYSFFRNKEDLYRTLIRELTGRFEEALRKAIEEPVGEVEKLRGYVRAKGEVFRGNASVIRLYIAETQGASLDIGARLDSELKKRRSAFLQSLAAVFESGMKRKAFRRIADPYHLAVALNGLTNALLLQWLEEPERHPYPENPDAILNIFLKGLVD
ncbi:MAG: TetR/AcrR family transcriptional regulator, partial [Verrucomicrobiota bacterium]